MNWLNLVLKNIRRTARRYLGYLLASAMAVTVFCMFTIFVDNPAVQQGYLTQTAREETYFLLSQVFVIILNRLRRSRLHGIGLLIVARLAYRLRDNARMMTLVTLLNAAVVTGMGAVFGVLVLVQLATPRFAPFTLQLASNTAHPAAITAMQVRHEAEIQGLNVQKEVDSLLLTGQITNASYPLPVSVLSLSAFRGLHEAALQAHPELHQHPSTIADLHADQAYIYPTAYSGLSCHAYACCSWSATINAEPCHQPVSTLEHAVSVHLPACVTYGCDWYCFRGADLT